MKSISTFTEYTDARKEEKRLFSQYWPIAIPGLIMVGMFVIALAGTSTISIPNVLFWIFLIAGIPGFIMSYKGMIIWRKIMGTDKACRDFLNRNQSILITFFNRDSALEKIESAVHK